VNRAPEHLRKKLDLAIPDKPQPLDSLLMDCKIALKHQVKTGKSIIVLFSLCIIGM
jgi:hypothetical protein